MILNFGKHKGSTLEELVLKNPDYVEWFLASVQDKPWLTAEFKRLISRMDKKPFAQKCHGCGQVAARASAYRGDSDLMFWCDDCNITDGGAERGKVHDVRTFGQVLRHIDWTASGSVTFKRQIVRSLAEGKGLPRRVGTKEASAFFA